jgi:hypothetical protein
VKIPPPFSPDARPYLLPPLLLPRAPSHSGIQSSSQKLTSALRLLPAVPSRAGSLLVRRVEHWPRRAPSTCSLPFFLAGVRSGGVSAVRAFLCSQRSLSARPTAAQVRPLLGSRLCHGARPCRAQSKLLPCRRPAPGRISDGARALLLAALTFCFSLSSSPQCVSLAPMARRPLLSAQHSSFFPCFSLSAEVSPVRAALRL